MQELQEHSGCGLLLPEDLRDTRDGLRQILHKILRKTIKTNIEINIKIL